MFSQTMLKPANGKGLGLQQSVGLPSNMVEGVNTLGLPVYQKETRHGSMQYQKDLEQSLSIYKKQLQAL